MYIERKETIYLTKNELIELKHARELIDFIRVATNDEDIDFRCCEIIANIDDLLDDVIKEE